MGESTNVNVFGSIRSVGEFNAAKQWSLYQERLEQYMMANGIPADRQVAVLLTVVGAKTYSVLRDLCDPNTPSTKKYAGLVKILNQHYSPKVAAFRKRQEFYLLQQKSQESVNDWHARLKIAASCCKFGGMLDFDLKTSLLLK